MKRFFANSSHEADEQCLRQSSANTMAINAKIVVDSALAELEMIAREQLSFCTDEMQIEQLYQSL